MLRAAIGIGAALTLAACEALVSKQEFTNVDQATAATPARPAVGIPYHLPRALTTVIVLRGRKAGRQTYVLSLGSTEFVPDRRYRFVLAYRASMLSHDHYCATVSNDGLLGDVHFAAADKTDEIIVEIARFAATLASMPALPLAPTRRESATELDSNPVEVYRGVVDLLDSKDRARITAAMNAAIGVARGQPRLSLAVADASFGDAGTDTKPIDCSKGICFRTLIKVPIELKVGNDTVATAYADVADTRNVGMIDVRRYAMVEGVTKLGFQRGVLRYVNVQKPSEGLQIARLPLSVLNAIVDAPISWFERMAAALTAQGKAVDAEKGLILKITELERAVRDLEQARATQGRGTTSTGTLPPGTRENAAETTGQKPSSSDKTYSHADVRCTPTGGTEGKTEGASK